MQKPALPLTDARELAQTQFGQLRTRNRLLATLLAGVAALGFITVMSLAVLLHYAEAHHLLANL